jgi:hypothetical protein
MITGQCDVRTSRPLSRPASTARGGP